MLGPVPFAADSIWSEVISEGVVHRYMYSAAGPWAIHILDVALDRCTGLQAVKGFPGAVGREKTSTLLTRLNDTVAVVGGVNADFFLFTPPGVPVGAHISRGMSLTDPAPGRPVLAIDSAGAAHAIILRADTLSNQATLSPFHPMEAVGGRPVVVRDSAITSEARDTVSFSVTRHPRTAAGITSKGRRVMLVVIDGRQLPYSAGMTLAEVAELMLSLGARDAINLDGGGSTTMVVATGPGRSRRREPGAQQAAPLHVVNRPSDPQGERAVGNALAIVRRC